MTIIDHDLIAADLDKIELVHGVGSDLTHACSIAALNIALTGELTDKCAPCMSPAVHRFVIRVQDRMPVEMMNGDSDHARRWRAALPFVAGSSVVPGEYVRRVLLDWMWLCLGGDVVPSWVPGHARDAWAVMLAERTAYAAEAAASAAHAAYAAHAAASAAHAADAAAYAAHAAASAASYAAHAADAADAAARSEVWVMADPAGVLEQLVAPVIEDHI